MSEQNSQNAPKGSIPGLPPRSSKPKTMGTWFVGLINNIMSRSTFWNRGGPDKRRNIQDECGHPKHDEVVDAELYQRLYDRDAIAARVVELMPRESWQVTPEVYEDEDEANATPFEDGIKEVNRQLHGPNTSYQPKHGAQTGSPIWNCLRRADIESGIGRYGVIFLGIDDGKRLEQPASMRTDLLKPDDPADNPSTVDRKLMFLRCFPESLAQISRYETNPSNPRFGQPVEYLITFHQPSDDTSIAEQPQATRKVHWTRVIHVAETHGSSPVFAKPRQEQVLDRLLDLQKIYGSCAEMYYKGAFPGLSFETHPQLGADADIDTDAILDQVENYANGLQRWMALVGVSAKSLAPQVVDPTPQIERLIEAICIFLGCPKRIFMGSERGELASSQDDAAWNDRLKERHFNYLSPCLIAAFFQRLIDLRVLPKPKQFYVLWPDLTSQTAKEKSAVTFQLTQALAQYVSSKAYKIMSLVDYLVRVFGMDSGEAELVVERADKEREKWSKDLDEVKENLNIKPNETGKKPPGQSGGSSGDGGGRGGDSTRKGDAA